MKGIYLGIKKGINFVLFVFFALFVVVFGTSTYKNIDPFNKGYATTDCMGVQPYTVLTPSMEPTIKAGDGVIGIVLSEEEKKDVKVGDIVTYTKGNPADRQIIIHRIVAIDEETGMITFKGDNNNTEDLAPVSYDQLQARYLVRIPGFGFLLEKVKTIPGMIGIVVFSGAIILVWGYLWDFIDTLVLGKTEEEYLKNEEEDSEDDDPKNKPNNEEPKEEVKDDVKEEVVLDETTDEFFELEDEDVDDEEEVVVSQDEKQDIHREQLYEENGKTYIDLGNPLNSEKNNAVPVDEELEDL